MEDSLDHSAIEILVYDDGDVLPVFIFGWHNVHSPENHSVSDEHRIVRDVSPNANPLPKAVHDVPFVLCIRRTRRERTVRIEVTSGIELRRVLAVNLRVVVAHRDVHHAHSSLWDEHALVPIVLEGTVWDPHGENGPPSEDLFDHGTQVRQARKIRERRYSASTHYGV